jgi:hypothetical protein
VSLILRRPRSGRLEGRTAQWLDDGDLPAQLAGDRFFGIIAWTPRTMSATCVTRKLTAMLHKA